MKGKLYTLILSLIVGFAMFSFKSSTNDNKSWIRINLIGYLPQSSKTAIWASKNDEIPQKFEIIEDISGKVVYTSSAIKAFGAYGPFTKTARLNFSDFKQSGRFYIRANEIVSPLILIGEDVYKGSADFCLRYMRQQRSGFNSFLKDSCHTHDGFSMYGSKAGIKDSTHFDAVGGWHDASDYLQYSTTSANAAYHLLMAYRDFPQVFADEKLANGLDGKNALPDVLDEAKWGLDWLIKMHPKKNIMFNQLADDRDHISMRIPKEDNLYGKGFERPLYFINGEPQQRGKFLNNTTGTSSTAAKFSSAFNLGSVLFNDVDKPYALKLKEKGKSAYNFALIKPGVTQTVSVKSPYIYAEDNWVDDMELAEASRNFGEKKLNQKYLVKAMGYAKQEPTTPWMLKDTAAHYQYYPFINLGHFELAKQLSGGDQKQIIDYYKTGIAQVWNRAKENAFYRGVPFIWCSNNLTVAFAIQCNWYAQLSNDNQFEELAQANLDWILGCNPWGTSMIYGLPTWGDTPTDPHSAFTHLKNYPIDGGLVDGPVYTNIYKNLIGIKLSNGDEYAPFQSDLAVYHDDYGDYSTNEPTMDGTASLVYLLASEEAKATHKTYSLGATIRGDSTKKQIALAFTGDEFADGATSITKTLKKENVKASFFLTGKFYRNNNFKTLINTLKKDGHYLGPHSNQHLLYCDWTKRDSLLVTQKEFEEDLNSNYEAIKYFGIDKDDANYFLPPYEWYNQTISNWTKDYGLNLINFTPGTRSNADYTYPEMGKSYRSAEEIYQSIINYNETNLNGLNGFILLLHIGTDPRRTDKFYTKLPKLISYLLKNGYDLVKINEMLKN